jgi:predicted SAM-dependent methyltransferase
MEDKTALGPSELHQVKNTWSPYDRLSQGTRQSLRRMWRSFGLNPGTASQLRYETDMLLLRARCALSFGYRRRVRELANRRDLRVHLGCGNALFPGWLNVDCYPPAPRAGIEILTLDMRQGLPLGDASVSALFTEHFLEHLPVEIVRETILPEIRRVLEPGGWVRIGVPDGEYFVNQYVAHREGHADPLFEGHRRGSTPMSMLNDIAHGFGHCFLYDFETMKLMLQVAGFSNVQRCASGTSEVGVFKDRDRSDPWRQAMSLYVEAAAPV